MVTIRHILKDGTQVDDVTGHVIKADDHKVLYEVIERINEKCLKKSVELQAE